MADKKLECPYCGSDQVKRLPPVKIALFDNQPISAYTSYQCGECGKKMRARGSLVVYLFVLALGIGLLVAFGFLMFSEDQHGVRIPLFKPIWLLPLRLICPGY